MYICSINLFRMKKIYFIITFLVLLSGCSKDASDTLRVADISFDISRSAELLQKDVSMKTAFIDNDKVGVFANDSQSQWSFSRGKWTATEPFFWSDNNKVSFCAYYPYYTAATLDSVPMPSLLGQTGSELDMISRDFITGRRTLSFIDNNGNVEFNGSNALAHQYAMLVLTIRSSLPNAKATFDSVTIEGKSLFNSAYYSFTDQLVHVSPNENQNKLYVKSSNFPTITEGRNYLLFKILVNPLTLDTHPMVTLGYVYNGKCYNITTDKLTKEFKSGFYYKYDLLINTKGELTVTGIEVNGRQEILLPNIVLPE